MQLKIEINGTIFQVVFKLKKKKTKDKPTTFFTTNNSLQNAYFLESKDDKNPIKYRGWSHNCKADVEVCAAYD